MKSVSSGHLKLFEMSNNIEPKVGMRFYSVGSGEHIITDVNDERILHTYVNDGGETVENAFLYTWVFKRLASQQVFYILNDEEK